MNNYVVRLNLKTDCNDRKELIDFCLNGKEQCLAIGGSYVYSEENVQIQSYSDYYYAIEKNKDGKLNSAMNVFWYAKQDDLFWTRDLNGYYWICRAKSEAKAYYGGDKDIGAIIPVEAYNAGMQITGQIKAAFNRPNAGTSQRIYDELIFQYSKYQFNKLSGKDYYSVEYIENDILANLPDFDLEELVILYLQIKYNYCVLSNSIASKSTTIKIECEFIPRNVEDKSKAVVQVKGGKSKSVNALDYESYVKDGYTVYLYAPHIENAAMMKNIIEITESELRSFYYEYKKILPLSITMWESILAKGKMN